MASTISEPKTTNKFAKSIGGSIKSLLNAGGRTYFVLEHKSGSDKHKAGETTEFIGDYIELGRGDSYAVNFGEDCRTVSRPHAAIIRNESNWTLRPLSKTNPTFLNNQKVFTDASLNNGDEIQLSTGGPRLSFLIPANNKVSGMGMTIRMKALMNEAIRPYKTAIATIAVVFILAVAGLSYFIYFQNEKISGMEKTLASYKDAQSKMLDSLRKIKPPVPPKQQQQYVEVPSKEKPTIQSLYPGVYYIQTSRVSYSIGGETKTIDFALSGTGFLLNDGRFVTARHVVEPWAFLQADSTIINMNLIASNGGKVVQEFTAYSSNGSRLTFQSTDFSMNTANDEVIDLPPTDEGLVLKVKKAHLDDGQDWAYCKVNSASGGLVYDSKLSTSLPAATPLYILGYPFGIAKGSNPVYSECKVSRDGINNGIIGISGRGFDTGNSGGPVFAQSNSGEFSVVGIVSAEQGVQGFIVPISAIQ